MNIINQHYYRLCIAKELGVIALALTVGTGVVFVIQSKVHNAVIAGASERAKRFEANLQREKFDHLRKELRASSDIRNSGLAALLPTEDIQQLTSSLDALATKYGITLTLSASTPIQSTLEQSKLKLFTVDITLQLIGTRTSVRNFISDTEKLHFFLSLTSFKEQYGTTGINTAQVSLRLWTKPTQELTQTP